MGWFDLVVGALAVARVVRLVAADSITEPVRDRLDEWYLNGPSWAWWPYELVTCPWCLSVWVGAAGYVWWAAHPSSWRAGAIIAAWSYVTGMAATREG